MLALKRLPEKHTLIKLAAQTNKRTQILIQTGRGKRQGEQTITVTNKEQLCGKWVRLRVGRSNADVRPTSMSRSVTVDVLLSHLLRLHPAVDHHDHDHDQSYNHDDQTTDDDDQNNVDAEHLVNDDDDDNDDTH